VADANGLPSGGIVGGGQARGGGQGINPIYTEGEGALHQRNPRGSGGKAASTAESRRPKANWKILHMPATTQRGGRMICVPRIREDGVGHG